MPTSRSSRPSTELTRPSFLRPLILVAVLAVVVVVVAALPASLVKHFLPPFIAAEDFSGSLWHGSAGRITVNSRDAGAIEWRLHPASLLSLTLSADLHWVKVGFVADASADMDRHGINARDIQGGGPIDDIADLGIASGWRGATSFKFSKLKVAFADRGGRANILSAVGELSVANLASPQVANGADLGGYVLQLADGAITPDADASAELSDTGGPLEVKATIHFSAKDHTGMLSGTVKERADTPPALRSQLDNLAQLHARDAQGRLPVDLEFTL
ncbi:MAG: ral secretion pathway protein [Gammaproteobacteria bacterium]|nr:ral secretion pathway protein [Gammaproteobacteria bacterium]